MQRCQRYVNAVTRIAGLAHTMAPKTERNNVVGISSRLELPDDSGNEPYTITENYRWEVFKR